MGTDGPPAALASIYSLQTPWPLVGRPLMATPVILSSSTNNLRLVLLKAPPDFPFVLLNLFPPHHEEATPAACLCYGP